VGFGVPPTGIGAFDGVKVGWRVGELVEGERVVGGKVGSSDGGGATPGAAVGEADPSGTGAGVSVVVVGDEVSPPPQKGLENVQVTPGKLHSGTVTQATPGARFGLFERSMEVAPAVISCEMATEGNTVLLKLFPFKFTVFTIDPVHVTKLHAHGVVCLVEHLFQLGPFVWSNNFFHAPVLPTVGDFVTALVGAGVVALAEGLAVTPPPAGAGVDPPAEQIG